MSRASRRPLAVALALVCTVALSSCALLRIFETDDSQADTQMKKIAAAVDDGDRDSLAALFSSTALDEASNFDEGMDYFLSFFPDGGLTWERETSVGAESENDHEIRTELLHGFYKVTADGKAYWLYFADFTVNDLVDPDNVGIYALGVIPWTDDVHSPEAEPFFVWANSIHIRKNGEAGYPGIYVPDASSARRSVGDGGRERLVSRLLELGRQPAELAAGEFSQQRLQSG